MAPGNPPGTASPSIPDETAPAPANAVPGKEKDLGRGRGSGNDGAENGGVRPLDGDRPPQTTR